ncbi:unnamed protein product, partial [Scytosiphon promiscuus]
VFDAGETLFIALVEAEEDEDGGSDPESGDSSFAETEESKQTQQQQQQRARDPLRKVVVREDYVPGGEGTDIFLVDHAWTFKAGDAREQLRSSDPLLQRMVPLMQVRPPLVSDKNQNNLPEVAGQGDGGAEREQGSGEDEPCREGDGYRRRALEGVLSALPTFSRRYGLGSAGMFASYVNDELGSAFRHSENPNCQMSLFMFTSPERGGTMAYSILWPLRPLRPSEEATLDLLRSTAWAGATSVAARGAFARGLGLPCARDGARLPADANADGQGPLDLPRDRLAKRCRRVDSWAVEHRARRATSAAAAAAYAPGTRPSQGAAPQPQQPSLGGKETDDCPGDGGGRGIPATAPTIAQAPPLPATPRPSSLGIGGGVDQRKGLQPLSVWTDLPHLYDGETGLTRPEFLVLDCGVGGASPRDADVVWASGSIDRKFEAAMGGLRPGQMINQFPYEAALVVKSHLARTIQREFGSDSPESDMMQPTFDMQSEDDALAFMAEFRRRRRDGGADNIWIVKPVGLARSMDTTVTGSLAGVLRAADTGPKVAQLYLSRPLLWRHRKFDLRVVALLVSSDPLELYVHDCYWPRVAERPHGTELPEAEGAEGRQQEHQHRRRHGGEASTSRLEDPRVSLTAMHLLGEGAAGRGACHPHYEDFAREMDGVVSGRNPGSTWDGVMGKTRAMILSVFKAAARQQPGMACPRARAIYGCDVMVTEDLEPRLLEVTFSPGNLAASPAWPVRQPNFLNEAFGCLFLGERKNVTRLA